MSSTTGASKEVSDLEPRLIKNRPAFGLFLLVLASLLIGVGLLADAQAGGSGEPPPLLPFVFLVLAGVGLALAEVRGPETAGSRNPTTPETETRWGAIWAYLGIAGLPAGVAPWQPIALLCAILLAIIVLGQLPRMDADANYVLVFLAWLAAILLYLIAVSPPQPATWREWPGRLRRLWAEQRVAVLLLAGIILVAFLARALAVGSIPYTLGGDEGSQGLEAIRVINREIRNPFTTGWLGVPTMSFIFNSITIRLLGATTLALRIPWVLVGTLTVFVTFFLVKRLTNLPIALATGGLLAVYHYHIHYSRLGSNQIADPLFVAMSLLFLYRALDRRSAFDWALTGIVTGLALYFYAGARFTPVIIIAVLLYAFIRAPRQFREAHFSGIAVMLGAFLITGAPMLQYAARFPDDFNARLNQVGIIQSGWLTNEVAITGKGYLTILFEQFSRAALAYHYYPDRTVWYGLREPLLDPFFGALFLMGLVYGTIRMFGDTNGQRLAPMVAWWWGGVLMGGMLTESPPSTQRLITTSVPTCFFVALALWQLLKLADAAIAGVPRRALMALGVLAFAVISLQTYFLEYTPQRIYGGQHAELATTLAPLLNEMDDGYYTYFVGAPWMYWGFATTPYLAREMPGEDIVEPLSAPPAPAILPQDKGGIFVFLPQRISELALVQQSFPAGEIREIRADATDGRLMATLYIVPPSQ